MTRALVMTCALAVAGAAPLSAQGLSVGAKAGISVATQTVTGDGGGPSLGNRTGLVAGAFVTMPLVSRLDLEADGLYTMKGARLTAEGIASTLQIDYFEVPVLVRVRLGGGRHHCYAGAGPSIGLRLRARARTAFGGATEEIDVADQVQSLDFGIAMGGGLTIGRLIVDGRYTLGRRDIDKDTTDTSRTFNRAIALTAGVRF